MVKRRDKQWIAFGRVLAANWLKNVLCFFKLLTCSSADWSIALSFLVTKLQSYSCSLAFDRTWPISLIFAGALETSWTWYKVKIAKVINIKNMNKCRYWNIMDNITCPIFCYLLCRSASVLASPKARWLCLRWASSCWYKSPFFFIFAMLK